MFDILKVVFLIRRRRILKSIEDLLKFRDMYLNLNFLVKFIVLYHIFM